MAAPDWLTLSWRPKTLGGYALLGSACLAACGLSTYGVIRVFFDWIIDDVILVSARLVLARLHQRIIGKLVPSHTYKPRACSDRKSDV